MLFKKRLKTFLFGKAHVTAGACLAFLFIVSLILDIIHQDLNDGWPPLEDTWKCPWAPGLIFMHCMYYWCKCWCSLCMWPQLPWLICLLGLSIPGRWLFHLWISFRFHFQVFLPYRKLDPIIPSTDGWLCNYMDPSNKKMSKEGQVPSHRYYNYYCFLSFIQLVAVESLNWISNAIKT